jgi:hypothetical protein
MAVIMETELMSVAGGAAGGAVAAAIMTGDAMCMVIVPAEPPVVERHMAAAAMVVVAVGTAAADMADTEPRNRSHQIFQINLYENFKTVDLRTIDGNRGCFARKTSGDGAGCNTGKSSHHGTIVCLAG